MSYRQLRLSCNGNYIRWWSSFQCWHHKCYVHPKAWDWHQVFLIIIDLQSQNTYVCIRLFYGNKRWFGWIYIYSISASAPCGKNGDVQITDIEFPFRYLWSEAKTNLLRNSHLQKYFPAKTTFRSCLTTWGMVTMPSSTASAFSSSKHRWVGKVKMKIPVCYYKSVIIMQIYWNFCLSGRKP